MKPALKFNDVAFDVIEHRGQPCLTLAEIARSLYGKGEAQSDTPFEHRLKKLFRRHSDEFTGGMTALLLMQTLGGPQEVRVFSLRGAHLLGMFARSERAKEFRRWVLDILDNQAEDSKTILSQFHTALAQYTGKKDIASLHGQGLSKWKREKTPLENRIQTLTDQMQGQIFIH